MASGGPNVIPVVIPGFNFPQGDYYDEFGMLAFLIAVAAAVNPISFFTYKWFVPRPVYDQLVCHHKTDAAAQACLVKFLIQPKTGGSVFIGSDDHKRAQ